MSGFDALALDRGYAFLDPLPAGLYAAVVTASHGDLAERARGVLGWREALLAGQLPDPQGLAWPAAPVRDAVLAELRALNLARFCRGEEELTDAVLLSVLELCELHQTQTALALPARLQALRAAELARRIEEQARRAVAKVGGKPSARTPQKSPEETLAADARALARLGAEAQRQAEAEALPAALAALRAAWQERARVWDELAAVFGDLGELLGRGFDLCRGILRSQGFLEIARLRALLEHVPALKALVQTLGRMQSSETLDQAPICEQILGPLRRAAEELREVRSPNARSETRGLVRSDDLARMLPAEASLLGHPRLRTLWHARRAERTLLCYQVEGVLSERTQVEVETTERQERPGKRRERGPILVCLDTSGSMAGLPEQVAKALVLETLRVANLERRACYLYAFSGPGQVLEHELALTPEGLGRLLSFLTASFHGGTDVEAPLLAAYGRLSQPTYERADLLVVSDGQFAVPATIDAALAVARRDRGLRVHGVLVSPAASPAMAALCDPLHRFLDWHALERGASGAPHTL